MRRYVRSLTASTQQTTYAGVAKEDKIEIPRDYLIQRIIIDIRGDIDLVSATALEDYGQRLIKRIRLESTGGKTGNKTIVDVSGVDLYFLNFYDQGEGMERVVPIANGTDLPLSMQFVLDFRLAKNNPDDYSVAIPSYEKSSLTLSIEWDTLANGYSASGASNCALTGKITLIEGIPETAAEFEAGKSNPLLTLTASEFVCSSGTGEEERNTDIPVGMLLRRLFIFARTSSNLRSDTEIDYLSLKKIDQPILEKFQWHAIGAEDEMDYDLANYDGNRFAKGLVCLDFARGAVDERGAVLGEDLRIFKSGDIKFTIYKNNASTKLRYLRESIEAVA